MNFVPLHNSNIMKKKILLFALFSLITCSLFSQVGWQPIRYKALYKDSVNFTKQFRINNTTVLANAIEFNLLNGALVSTAELNYLVGVDSLIQTQLHKRAFIWNPQFYGTAIKFNTDTLSTQAYTRLHGGGVTVDTTHLSARINAKADSLNAMFSGYVRTRQGGFLDTLGSQRYIRAYIGPPGGAVWGAIAGTLTNQTDLNTALGLKANLAGPTTFTSTIVLPTTTSIGTVSSTELGYLDNVTSAIQTQINNKFTNNVSATDLVLGRSSAGPGVVEEITMTAAGRALMDDASTTAQKTTLGLGNVTNESKATMFASPNITGSPTIAGYVPTSTTVNGRALSGNIAITAADVSAVAIADSAGMLDTYAKTSYVDTELADTTPLTTAIVTPAVKALIQAQIDSAIADITGGSGVTGLFYYLKGRVDVTDGIPNDGDSTLTHTNFIGKKLIVFREGKLQQQNTDNTQTDGYWVNNTTGEMTFRPVLAANEQLEIWSTNTILWQALLPEGGGGEPPPDTPLLDSLLAVWEMDEVSGTTVTDALGVNNGTTTATPNQTGKLGKSKLYNGITRSSIPYNASLIPDGDEYSISVWFYLTQLPSVSGHAAGLVRLCDAQAPYYTANLYIQTTNTIGFQVTNSTGTVYEYETGAGAVSTGQWYHLVAVNEGAGENAKIYLNGTNVCTYHPTAFTGSLLQFDSVVRIGNISDSGEYGTVGYIDQVILFKQALTGGFAGSDVTLLYNSTLGKIYPFN